MRTGGVRLLRIGLVMLVAAPFVGSAAHGTAAVRPGRCAVPSTLVAPALPAALTVETSCGTFAIRRDGHVVRVSSATTPYPNGTEWWPDTGVWLRAVHGHLVVGRGKRTLWRSHDRFPRTYEVGPIALTEHGLAFSYGASVSRLFVARSGGRERFVTRGEFPLGTAAGGFYTRGVHEARLMLRGVSGRLAATIARHVAAYAYEPFGRALLFIRQGRLFRASGARVQPLADLSRLGLARSRWLQILPLGRLVGLEDEHRLVVLGADGAPFASTPLPVRRARSDFVSGQPVASAEGVVAFAVMHPRHRVESQVIERGTETVYLLRAGARAAVPVHAQEMKFNVCGHGATLAWHGAWLLYSVGEGPAALVDTRTGAAIGLSFVVRRLPGYSGVEESGPLSLAWS